MTDLQFDERGLLPAIVQDAQTRQVLMHAWVNREALDRTMETGKVHFWSRSRRSLWRKGETSGNELKLLRAWRDCDDDTLLFEVQPKGPTCHTGEVSCFYRALEPTRVG